jgi:formate/nitrite transporter
MAWLSGRVTLTQLLRNWAIVYAGNFVGSMGMAAIMYETGQFTSPGYEVGATALSIANSKVNLTFMEALARGILCNILVCLAIWVCLSGRSTVDRILGTLLPVSAFVASGFEHSIANMYFIPLGLLLRGHPEVLAVAGTAAAGLTNLSISGFVRNLVPVTIGNVIGGGFVVAAVYWFVYLSPRERREQPASGHQLEVFPHRAEVLEGQGARRESR